MLGDHPVLTQQRNWTILPGLNFPHQPAWISEGRATPTTQNIILALDQPQVDSLAVCVDTHL